MVDPKGCLSVEIVFVHHCCLLQVQYASKGMKAQVENAKISWGKIDVKNQKFRNQPGEIRQSISRAKEITKSKAETLTF